MYSDGICLTVGPPPRAGAPARSVKEPKTVWHVPLGRALDCAILKTVAFWRDHIRTVATKHFVSGMLGVVLTKSCGTPKQVVCRVIADSE